MKLWHFQSEIVFLWSGVIAYKILSRGESTFSINWLFTISCLAVYWFVIMCFILVIFSLSTYFYTLCIYSMRCCSSSSPISRLTNSKDRELAKEMDVNNLEHISINRLRDLPDVINICITKGLDPKWDKNKEYSLMLITITSIFNLK